MNREACPMTVRKADERQPARTGGEVAEASVKRGVDPSSLRYVESIVPHCRFRGQPHPLPCPSELMPAYLEMLTLRLASALESLPEEARERMAHAALLSGMALANSGLGMAHGVAAALGVHCRVPHGLACAVMLPVAMRVNAETSRRDLAELARVITGREWPDERAAAEAAIEGIEAICRRIGIPERLSELGVTAEQIPDLVRDSRGNSMSGNPRELSDGEVQRILEHAL